MRLKFALLLFILLSVSGCFLGKKKLVVDFKNPSTFTTLNTQISSVQVANNQLIIKGSDLSTVTGVKLQTNIGEEVFTVESSNPTQIIANSVRKVEIAVGKVFNLILADAYGSAVYQVTFNLDNQSITAPMLSSMGATSGQILKYNGSTWIPSNLPSAQTYKGAWNASTNSPDITSNLALFENGDYYIVTTTGTINASPVTAGDWVMFNGTSWDKIDNSSNVVASFKGRRGTVVPLADDYTWSQITKTGSRLQDIADIDITNQHDGDTLTWNVASSKWVSSAGVSSPGPGSITTTELANSSITYAKLNLTDGDIPQIKINGLDTTLAGKENSITAGTTLQYYRGDKTWQALPWIVSGSNVYFSTGNVGIGTATPGYALDVNGSIRATSFLYSSDRRLKKNIVPISDSIEKLMDLNGVMFKWKKTGEPAMGFIAQEVEKVIPEVVKTDPVSHYKSVQYANIVALIVEAFKSFHQEVKNYTNQMDHNVANIEEENALLKEKIKIQQTQIDQLAQRLDRLEKK